MKKPSILFVLCTIIAALPGYASSCPVEIISTPTSAAQGLAIAKLGQFLKCDASDTMNDQSPCNTFVGRGLEAIYGVTDFKTPTGYKNAGAIADQVAASDKWVKIGPVFDENNNLCAQAIANNGLPVIAVKNDPEGHIALIIPGEPTKSGTWGFMAAMSASFLHHHPESAYISGLLSKAYGPDTAKQAVFYYRKPNNAALP